MKSLIERIEYLTNKKYDTQITLIYDWVITEQITIDTFKYLIKYITNK